MKYISKNLEETEKIAKDFVEGLSPKESGATIVGLYGDLGAGKTTLTQSIARALGVGEKVASPTFVIMKIYQIADSRVVDSRKHAFYNLIHIDAYRMDSSDELARLGWSDMISDPHNLILIEWPERVAEIMPEHIQIKLKTVSDPNSREIDISV